MTTLLLAVDGGATKTAFTLRDERGTILFQEESSGSNYQVIGTLAFKELMLGTLKRLALDNSISTIDIGVFALAGIDTDDDYNVVKEIVIDVLQMLDLKIGDLVIENDAYSTLVGVTMNKPGVLLISGTGSIAYAHDGKGTIARSGGWGHRTGDEGSGYWIGKQIIQSIFKMEDGRGPDTILKEAVLVHLNLNTINDLTQWLYGRNYTVDGVAALSVLLEKTCELGDLEANRILQEAVSELKKLVSSVIHSANLQHEICTIFFNGGTIKNFGLLYRFLKSAVENEESNKQVTLCNELPIELIVRRAMIRLE